MGAWARVLARCKNESSELVFIKEGENEIKSENDVPSQKAGRLSSYPGGRMARAASRAASPEDVSGAAQRDFAGGSRACVRPEVRDKLFTMPHGIPDHKRLRS